MVELKKALRDEYGLFRYSAYILLIQDVLSKQYQSVEWVSDAEWRTIQCHVVPQIIMLEEERQLHLRKDKKRKSKPKKNFGFYNWTRPNRNNPD